MEEQVQRLKAATTAATDKAVDSAKAAPQVAVAVPAAVRAASIAAASAAGEFAGRVMASGAALLGWTMEAAPDTLRRMADQVGRRPSRPPAAAVRVGAPGVATRAADAAAQRVAEATRDGAQTDSTPAAAKPLDQAATEAADEVPALAAPSSDELPLEGYDGLTLPAIRARLRSLDVEQLVQIRAYEQAHANRLQIVTMFENRIAKLQRNAEEPPTSNEQEG